MRGTFSIYGTPDSKKHLTRLKKIFGLNKIDKLEQFDLEEDFKDDPHYRVKQNEKRLLDEVIQSSKTQFQEKPSELKIAGWTKSKPDPRKVYVSKVD
jgi:tyrosyl-tRNA synthetase